MANWTINLDNLASGGYAPHYWYDTYPSYGNKNMAGAMQNMYMLDPNFIMPGLAKSVITGTVTQTMKGISDVVISSLKSYGFGGTTLYEIQAGSVTAKRVIASAAGYDVALYDGELKYVYDTSTGGDIGTFNLNATYDDDWWTAVAGGADLTKGKIHQLLVGGTTGLMTILNGSVVASWDGTTAVDEAFDTQDTDIELVSQVYTQGRFYFAGNKPNIAGRNEGSIFIWNGNADSWQSRITVNGSIGAMYIKDGVIFIVYTKGVSIGTGKCTLGYIDGLKITDVANYWGTLPAFYQITELRDFIIWTGGTTLWAWGAGDVGEETRLFQFATVNAGGLATPFGIALTAASDKLEQLTGTTTTASWKSLMFDITSDTPVAKSRIDKIKVNFEKLTTGQGVTVTLTDNKGTSLYTGTISHTGDGAVTKKIFYPHVDAENFRVELDWSSGGGVKIKSIKTYGHTV